MLCEEHQLVTYQTDFGQLIHSAPPGVFEAPTIEVLQQFMDYAYQHNLPLTIRGKGMSQSGQSLSSSGSCIVSMNQLNNCANLMLEDNGIWIDANSTWSDLLHVSLPINQAPLVIPYNCNLSIAGVLSAGGVGATSFKFGTANAQVNALEIVKTNGELICVDANSPQAQACLGGQGLFGIITRAFIKLRPCLQNVKTFFLIYLDKDAWLADLKQCQQYADYIESFCSPTIVGAKLTTKGRSPFAEWFYVINLSVEFNLIAPELTDFNLSPWKLVHVQEEPINSFLHRHNSRFEVMKATGQWALTHPWYECFLPEEKLKNLTQILASLPIFYANIVQVIPVSTQFPAGFLMLPQAPSLFSVMILNPGVVKTFVPACIDVINYLDSEFLPEGKRYLSGFLPNAPQLGFWEDHFTHRYSEWIKAKTEFDPKNLLKSYLFNFD